MRSAWLVPALFLTAQQAIFGQSALAMPAWLANYPDVTAQTTKANGLVESNYTAVARPEAVSGHYRKLFEAQNLPFVPNFDGMGTVVRAAAADCDLLISIRAEGKATLVRVDCTGPSPSSGTWKAAGESGATLPRTGTRRLSSVTGDSSYNELVKRMNIHPVYKDAPAPPLVWPEWLVHVKGGRLAARQGVDRAGHQYLKSTYVTSAPMTAIHMFYEDLLKSHEYPVHSGSLGTGQTISGIVQNASGHAEGHNYPNGHPGPYTEIHVSYRRSNLNDPITVDLRFTTYEFKAPPPFER